MTKDDLIQKLCYFDRQSPSFDHQFKKKEKCQCDNCFYDLSDLARSLLDLYESLDDSQNIAEAMETIKYYKECSEWCDSYR